MKRLILCLLAASMSLSVTNTFAQDWFKKGDIVLGTSTNLGLNFYKIKDQDQKWTSFNFNPNAGYFVCKDLILGLGINYSMISNKSGSMSYTTTNFGIGPFVRYYAPFGTDKLKPFAQAGYFTGSGSTQTKGSTNDFKSHSSSGQLHLSAGFSYLLNNRLFLDATLDYANNTNSYKLDGNTSKTTTTGFGFNAGIGFRF